MSREQLATKLAEIRAIREQVLSELNDLTEDDFPLKTDSRPWRWDTLRRVLLRFGDHMREHSTHLTGTRATLGLHPTQPQRMLAEAELAWGVLLAAVVALSDEDLDRQPPGGGWSIRQILDHVRDSEQGYLEAIRLARIERRKDA